MVEVMDRTTLKALSTETRQEIVRMLAKRPYTASELSKLLNKHVTTITEHLGVLERSNVIRKKESSNKWVYYTLTDKGEKFFKPYYSWILVLSFSLVAFAVGIYEMLFIGPAAVSESAPLMKAVNAPAAADISTGAGAVATAYDTSLIVGAAAILVGVALLAAVFLARRSHERRINSLMARVRLLDER
jgi:DNA-binding transcriptional ArsR family regulator